ncbi:unnamed protein product [Cercospora beticola]|nr:unnamed protein product [Cercospora beticola]
MRPILTVHNSQIQLSQYKHHLWLGKQHCFRLVTGEGLFVRPDHVPEDRTYQQATRRVLASPELIPPHTAKAAVAVQCCRDTFNMLSPPFDSSRHLERSSPR